jgi:hypothetical protein
MVRLTPAAVCDAHAGPLSGGNEINVMSFQMTVTASWETSGTSREQLRPPTGSKLRLFGLLARISGTVPSGLLFGGKSLSLYLKD